MTTVWLTVGPAARFLNDVIGYLDSTQSFAVGSLST